MAGLCFICANTLSEGDLVNVVRGFKTLRDASIARNDGHIDFLNNLTSVSVHDSCRKVYVNKNCIAASIRRRLEAPEPSTPSTSFKRNETFDFKNLCLFCGKTADVAAESGNNEKHRRTICKVRTLQFRDNVISKAEERKDPYGELVRDRVLHEYDLIAAGAKYHVICFTNFLSQVSSTENKPRRLKRVTQAMEQIFTYIENNEASQFTLKELKDCLTEYVPDDQTILARLQQKYSTDLEIKRKLGTPTTISRRKN